MISKITGKENKTLKLIKSLKKKNGRTKENMFIAEGKRICEEAICYAKENIYCIVLSDSFFEREFETVKSIEEICDKIYVVSDGMFSEISDTDTPQGIIVVLKMNNNSFEVTEEINNIVVLDMVSEPGNLGTIIRTAEALGFDGIYLTKGCADIYSPKVVRSTMGSIFRMKIKNNATIEDILSLKNRGFSLISTTPDGDVALESFSNKKKFAVVIGNEAHGVCDDILNISDYRVKITMDGYAESFNAAVAAGIVLHWLKCR